MNNPVKPPIAVYFRNTIWKWEDFYGKTITQGEEIKKFYSVGELVDFVTQFWLLNSLFQS